MDVTTEKLLEHHGWEVECESPFEIRHKEDGSFATGQAANIVMQSLRDETKIIKFIDAAMGARFQYLVPSGEFARTWIKISDEGYGLIAEYDPRYMCEPRWTGQQMCSFADTREDVESLQVILMED